MGVNLRLLITGVALLAAMSASAGADDASEFTKVYDIYNQKAAAGDLEGMLALRTKAAEQDIRPQIAEKVDREYFLLIARAQVPESYQVEHLARTDDGKSAELYALLQLPAMKEIRRPRTRMEMLLTFAREGGAWKLGDLTLLGNPDEVKRPKNLDYRESEANTDVTAAEVAGRIVSIEFKPDHTLIMLRVIDEEVAVFLPPEAVLKDAGVDFDEWAPWKRRIFTGYPHQSDPQKFFATGDSPME